MCDACLKDCIEEQALEDGEKIEEVEAVRCELCGCDVVGDLR